VALRLAYLTLVRVLR
jgi:putative transposase